MDHCSFSFPDRRRGFTLVEMLVVLSLILLLAAFAVAFVPRMTERARSGQAGDRLQMWLLISKQWAKRDRVPTGVRLQPGRILPNQATPNTTWVTDLQYIQQPDDLNFKYVDPTTGIISSSQVQYTQVAAPSYISPAGQLPAATITGSDPRLIIDFYAGNGPGNVVVQAPYPPYLFPNVLPLHDNQSLWAVQPGDCIEFQGGGLLHRVYDVVSSNTLILASDSGPFTPTYQYRIIRAPRILAGEPALQLPQDIAIDLTTNARYNNPVVFNADGSVDILFSPSGNLIGANSGGDKINLWVRDVTQDAATPGDMRLITVFVRTGFIAAYPVDNSVKTTSPSGAAVGSNVTMTVQDATSITAGMNLILDLGTAAQETVYVVSVSSNSVVLAQVNMSHAAGCSAVSDPYNFTRTGRSSGM